MGCNVWEAKVLLGLYCQGVRNRICDLLLVISKHVTNINVTPYEIHIQWMFVLVFCTFFLSDLYHCLFWT